MCGIDHSELMLGRARRRNTDGLRRGVVDLRLGSVDELLEFDAPFDKILAVNTMLFLERAGRAPRGSSAVCCGPAA